MAVIQKGVETQSEERYDNIKATKHCKLFILG
jgi:hypothetical protein